MPCRTSRTRGAPSGVVRPVAKSRSCSSSSSGRRSAVTCSASALPPPGKPSVASVGMRREVDGPRGQPEQLGQRSLLLRRRVGVVGVLRARAPASSRCFATGPIMHPCQDAGVHLLFDRRGTPAGELDQAELVELLRFPVPPSDAWLRTNFVATVDGSITGPDAASGSISPASDQHHFALHRALCDAVVVAGGTARAEGYRAVDLADWQRDVRAAEGLAPYPTLVVVTASADLDPQIATPAQGTGGPVVVATTTVGARRPARPAARGRGRGPAARHRRGRPARRARRPRRARAAAAALRGRSGACTATCSPSAWSTRCCSRLAPPVVGGPGSRTTRGRRARRPRRARARRTSSAPTTTPSSPATAPCPRSRSAAWSERARTGKPGDLTRLRAGRVTRRGARGRLGRGDGAGVRRRHRRR